MTLKERFINWVEKRDKKMQEQDELRSRQFRKGGYHRFFEGYTEYTVLKPNGKEKIVRVYTAAYYKAALSTPLYALCRLGYIVLCVAAVIFMLSATTRDIGCNYVWYVNVPVSLSFPAIFATCWCSVSAALADREMKLRHMRTIHKILPIAAIIAAGTYMLSAISMLIFMLIHLPDTEGTLYSLLMLLVSCICTLAIWFIENHVTYNMVENPVEPQPGGVEIR